MGCSVPILSVWGALEGVSYMFEGGHTPVTPCAKVDTTGGMDPMWHMDRVRVPRVPGGVRRGQSSAGAKNSHPFWQQGWGCINGVQWGCPRSQLQGQA